MDEGVWVGFDEQSKGCRVYWPKKRTVTVERNVYFDGPKVLPDHLEGEDFEIIEEPAATSNSTHDAKQPHHHPTENETFTHKETPADIQEHPVSREKRIRKPSQRIQDIIDGRGVTSDRPSNPVLAQGIQTPTVPQIAERTELEGEGSADQISF